MKKSFVKIAWEEDSYRYQDADIQEMCILGCFLASDVGCYTPGFKEGILDTNCRGLGGNITDIYKENDYILLGDQLSEQPDRGPFLKVPKQEFIRLLDEWEKICKQKPQEVLITFDGERFTIETKQ